MDGYCGDGIVNFWVCESVSEYADRDLGRRFVPEGCGEGSGVTEAETEG